MKKVLIVLGVIVVVGIVGAALAWRTFVSRQTVWIPGQGKVTVQERGKDGEATITFKSDKGGELVIGSTKKLSEAELGAPIYPGSKQDESGAITISGSEKEGGKYAAATFTTGDAFDKVLTFYKGKLGAKAGVSEFSSGEERTALLTVAEDGNSTTQVLIAQEKDSGDVKITITHSSK